MKEHRTLSIIGLVFTLVGAIFSGVGTILAFALRETDPEAWIMSVVFGGIGGTFLVLGIIFLLVTAAGKRHIARLLREGTPYDASIVRAYYNSLVQVNGQQPLVLECQYTDMSGATHLVKSSNLYNYNLLQRPEDFQARVYVEPYNPKRYYVQIIDQPGTQAPVDYDDR